MRLFSDHRNSAGERVRIALHCVQPGGKALRNMLDVATTVSARALSLEASSRPDTLKQTDQLIKQKTLADGVGHTFVLEVGDGAHR
jgi:hypothetical protein